MPLFFQHDIDEGTRLAVWKIEEEEAFFLQQVSLQREITHPHKRLQHLAGRYLLRYLFADFPVGLIKIADTRKPFLEDETFHFSISHCSNYAAAIVSKTKRVGMDIEVPTPKVEKIKHKFLHVEELGMAKNQPSDLLTLLWCCKEAVFKWWSYGGVDFSEMIRLQPFELQPSGTVESAFIAEQTYPLQLYYQSFEALYLVWVAH